VEPDLEGGAGHDRFFGRGSRLGGSNPVCFSTVVFCQDEFLPDRLVLHRWSAWDDAVSGHEATVDFIRALMQKHGRDVIPDPSLVLGRWRRKKGSRVQGKGDISK
jgi:hypothetical protein